MVSNTPNVLWKWIIISLGLKIQPIMERIHYLDKIMQKTCFFVLSKDVRWTASVHGPRTQINYQYDVY